MQLPAKVIEQLDEIKNTTGNKPAVEFNLIRQCYVVDLNQGDGEKEFYTDEEFYEYVTKGVEALQKGEEDE